jgi:hypothetical protein
MRITLDQTCNQPFHQETASLFFYYKTLIPVNDIPHLQALLPQLILPNIRPSIALPSPHLLRLCRAPFYHIAFDKRGKPLVPALQPTFLLISQATSRIETPQPNRDVGSMRNSPLG